jgi:Uma2 family endonuclease
LANDIIINISGVRMSQSIDERVRWTSADLELLPDNGNRYEIIDGELFVTRAPHWGHQKATGNIYAELRGWVTLNRTW